MRYNNEVFVKYRIDKDSIVFWTSDINENISAAKVLNEFLYDFSKGKKIFFHGYRLPEEHLSQIVDTKYPPNNPPFPKTKDPRVRNSGIYFTVICRSSV